MKYSKRNHGAVARRHHRVTKKEVALSPAKSFVIPKQHKEKIAVSIMLAALIIAVKWFFIGYFAGKRNAC
ncbi:MAG: hypothetical protein FWD01_05670 [Defluviitaleaceae bacterium]|nr:hypothetical protein [Defluviitaleaceae bacterium]